MLEKDFNIHLKKHNKIRRMFKLDYNIKKLIFIYICLITRYIQMIKLNI